MSQVNPILKVLQKYWRWSRSLTLGAQGCILDARNRVLLIRHTYRPGWHFPGGGVEKRETVGQALNREIWEETGIIIDAPPRLFAIYANHELFPGDQIALYIVRNWHLPSPMKPTREIAEQAFFERDKLPVDINPRTARRIAEILESRPPAEMW